jgi:hypothetical protein
MLRLFESAIDEQQARTAVGRFLNASAGPAEGRAG